LEQLKGKRLGISGYGAATHFAALIVATHLNLDPDKDMILVPGGPDAERVAAMSAGKSMRQFLIRQRSRSPKEWASLSWFRYRI
jgi:hypothetical protein